MPIQCRPVVRVAKILIGEPDHLARFVAHYLGPTPADKGDLSRGVGDYQQSIDVFHQAAVTGFGIS